MNQGSIQKALVMDDWVERMILETTKIAFHPEKRAKEKEKKRHESR
jgi:hypothetical protein